MLWFRAQGPSSSGNRRDILQRTEQVCMGIITLTPVDVSRPADPRPSCLQSRMLRSSPRGRASRGEVRTHATCTRYRPPPQPLRPRQVTAVAECAIQLSGFKNVDLFSQGVYQVRVRAYADRSGRAAVPFAITELPLPPLPGSVNSEQLLPAHRRLRAPLGSATG